MHPGPEAWDCLTWMEMLDYKQAYLTGLMTKCRCTFPSA